MRVLVTFGSKMGGTEGLARAVGEGLAVAGHVVTVRRASEIDGLDGWDAVLVGGALYMFRWYREARRFVLRHLEELAHLPVWFFSSGPLDDSASKGTIPPVGQVRRLMARVGARGHVTFGGRLDPERATGMARQMAKSQAGDWRDMAAAKAWGVTVGTELSAMAPRRLPAALVRPRIRERVRRVQAGLCLFTGVTACWGGVELILHPRGGEGSPYALPLSLLEHTPFRSYLVPGLLLFALVGLPNLAAWGLVLRRHRWSEIAAFGGGGALTVWILSEMALLRTAHWLHWVYLAAGVATMAVSLWLWLKRQAAGRQWRMLEA